MSDKHKDETKLNHDDITDPHGAVVPPIYQNSLFTFDSWEAIDDAFDKKAEAFIYSRLLNPTVKMAEEKIAAICQGEKAKLTASGIAAISSAILHCVRSGDHIIAVQNIYGPTTNFISKYLSEKFDIQYSFVDGTDHQNFAKAIKPNTRLIYLESPSSLTYRLQDIEAIVKIARGHNIKTVIDNTWATPIFQKPLSMGVDIEVHSVSKYLCGHSDVVAGVIVSSKEIIEQIILAEHEWLGAKMAPFEAWLILRSLRTLPIRMNTHMASALAICRFLENHKNVRSVYYPGTEGFPQYDLGQKQMSGYAGLLSFELDTGDLGIIRSVVNAFKIFKLGVSWGGHDSLVYAPVISYLKELAPDKFEAMGIKPGLIRISVGLEHPDDLIADLTQALDF